jgi:hypothetical protein
LGGRAKLIVAEPVKGDKGIARIDKATMTYLGVKEGDTIDVFGGIFSPVHVRVKVAKANPEDEGKGIIRIASDKMQEGNFKLGMKVTADTSWLKTLKETVSEKKKSSK